VNYWHNMNEFNDLQREDYEDQRHRAQAETERIIKSKVIIASGMDAVCRDISCIEQKHT